MWPICTSVPQGRFDRCQVENDLMRGSRRHLSTFMEQMGMTYQSLTALYSENVFGPINEENLVTSCHNSNSIEVLAETIAPAVLQKKPVPDQRYTSLERSSTSHQPGELTFGSSQGPTLSSFGCGLPTPRSWIIPSWSIAAVARRRNTS